jgi:hypothetical protein
MAGEAVGYNEQETRFFLIDPKLRDKGYTDHEHLKLETPAPVEPTGPKGRRRSGPGRTDYLLCVRVGDMPKSLPVGVLEAKKETEDPLKGMQQAKGYADCQRFDVKYVFATNGHLYGEYDFFTSLQAGPHPFDNFPTHPDLTARYAKDTGIHVEEPQAAILFQPDSPAWSQTRYYQDAAISDVQNCCRRCVILQPIPHHLPFILIAAIVSLRNDYRRIARIVRRTMQVKHGNIDERIGISQISRHRDGNRVLWRLGVELICALQAHVIVCRED